MGWQPRLSLASPAPPVNPPRSHVSVSWAPAAGRWSRVPPLWEGFLPGLGSSATRGPALLTAACAGSAQPEQRRRLRARCAGRGAELQLLKPFMHLRFGSPLGKLNVHGEKEVLPRAALMEADSSPLEMPALVCRAQLCVFPISLTLVNHPAISKHTQASLVLPFGRLNLDPKS